MNVRAQDSLTDWHLRFLALLLISGLAACGGGGGNSGGGNSGGGGSQPQPDFSLAVSPTNQSVDVGGSSSISLSATAINGFSSQISIQVSGLPAGVSLSPASITLAPGTPQQVTLTASANAAPASATVTITGQSGSLTHTAPFSLSVLGALTTRTRYVRTDATTEYLEWINAHWIIYNPVTNYFYVADPDSNRIMVLDPVTETEVGVISVPGAYSIDDTPDHMTLWVGTVIGDVCTVDPVAMAVTNRYIGSQIRNLSFPANPQSPEVEF